VQALAGRQVVDSSRMCFESFWVEFGVLWLFDVKNCGDVAHVAVVVV
jgi:hypothetical protein